MSLRPQVIPIPRPLLCARLALIVLAVAAEPASAETALTWANAPALGAHVGAVGATSAVGSWTEVPLGTVVTGDGTYAFALDTASSNSAIYDSREGPHPPELVLSTG